MASIRYACPGCGVVVNTRGRCVTCGPARKSLTTTQRGYDSDHRRRRSVMVADAVGLPCALCGNLMQHGEALDLDHSVPLSVDAMSKGDRVVHASCNRSRGNRT